MKTGYGGTPSRHDFTEASQPPGNNASINAHSASRCPASHCPNRIPLRPVILDSAHDLLAKYEFGKCRFHKQTHGTAVSKSLIQKKRIGWSLHVDASRESDRISFVTDSHFRTATSRQKFSRGIQEPAPKPFSPKVRIHHQHAQVARLSLPGRHRQSKPGNPGVHPCN